MKILIIGTTGQLGSQLLEVLNKGTTEIGQLCQVFGSSQINCTSSKDLDITDLKLVMDYFRNYKADLVINTAGFTNVDLCESLKDEAFKVNSLGARNIAMASDEVGAKLIHISTDYVFDGDSSEPYREYDVVNPKNVYGKTKLLGENYVQEFCRKSFIIRTAWLYGYNGKNFVKTILNVAKEKKCIEVVDDQMGTPTNAEDLVHHILKIGLTEEYGIYHCTGEGICTWYDFAKKIIEYGNIQCEVSPIKSDKLCRAAKRPAYSALDNMMIRCSVGDEMRFWEDALRMYIDNVKL